MVITFYYFSGIVQRWEVLQAQAVERQRHSGQVRDLQRQAKSIRLELECISDRASDLARPITLEDATDLSVKIRHAKVSPGFI